MTSVGGSPQSGGVNPQSLTTWSPVHQNISSHISTQIPTNNEFIVVLVF